MTAEELLDKGTDYLHVFGGVDEDYEQAMNYFVKAEEAGSIRAMDKIGFMYQYGYGVTKNKSETVK
ncbi:MAG: sel1 repeat family protein [Selenomonadaceae bacterium]|nr:sel1 repeat family protein [Selenomonadaceae bacterium]